MSENFKEDPTRQTPRKSGEAAGIRPPDVSPEQRRLMEDRRVMSKAANTLSDALRTWGDGYSSATQEWFSLLNKSMSEAKGSINQEHDDMAEAVSMLAYFALTRDDPSGISEVPAEIRLESAEKKEVTRNALVKAFERYPTKLAPTDFSKENIAGTMSRLARELKTSAGHGSIGDQLRMLSEKKEGDPYATVAEMDGVIQALSESLGEAVRQDIQAGHTGKYDREGTPAYDDDERQRHRRDAAAVLPQLKALMQLRGNLSLRLLGAYKSPDEVLAIQHLRGSTHEVSSRGNERTEREKTQNEVLKALLREGSSQMNISMSNKIPGVDRSGFQTRTDARFGQESRVSARPAFVSKTGRQASEFELSEMLAARGINEVMELRPVRQDVFEDREVEVPKSGFAGMFGGKDKRVERVRVGTRSVMHAEKISGGANEPLVELAYNTVDNSNAPAYQDHSNRFGQSLAMVIRLPESVARKSLEIMRTDPSFIRKIVEQAALAQQKIPEATWRAGENNAGYPLRPPYEKWSASHEGKANVYIRSTLDGADDLKVNEKDIYPIA